jgi:hypothetical protein
LQQAAGALDQLRTSAQALASCGYKITSPAKKARTTNSKKITMAAKNNHFAIVDAPEAIPLNPRNPATTEMTKKINAHFST